MEDVTDRIGRARSLIEGGGKTAARECLLQLCDDYPEESFVLMNAAIMMFNAQWLDTATLDVIERALAANNMSPDLWFLYAHTSFHVHADDRNETRGIKAAIRALHLDPKHELSYGALINTYLLQEKFWEAYMAHCTMERHLGADNEMAVRMRGVCEFLADPRRRPYIGFAVDEEKMLFTAETRTPQGVLTALNHANSKIVDLDALRYVRNFAGTADTVLEVGCQAGNHAAYLLRFLKPLRYLGFDENPDHVDITRRTAFMNKVLGVDTTIDIRNMAAGSSPGTVRAHGREIPRQTLDEVAPGPWSLIRFDVKDRTMEALAGAETILAAPDTRLMVKLACGDGGPVIDWLATGGYALIKTITSDGDDNHFLTNAPAA